MPRMASMARLQVSFPSASSLDMNLMIASSPWSMISLGGLVHGFLEHLNSLRRRSAGRMAGGSVDMLLLLMSRLVRDLLSCKKLNVKAWLGGLLTRLKTHGSLWKGFATTLIK